MLYKGKLQPSYLLCPEKYTWHLLDDDLANLLSQQKCTRFNTDPQAMVCGDFDPSTDLKYLRLLVDNERCLTYNDYQRVFYFFYFNHLKANNLLSANVIKNIGTYWILCFFLAGQRN